MIKWKIWVLVQHIYSLLSAISDFKDQDLYFPGVPIDIADSENNISKGILVEYPDLLVSILQSSDLQS